jgi:hypothetical protein
MGLHSPLQSYGVESCRVRAVIDIVPFGGARVMERRISRQELKDEYPKRPPVDFKPVPFARDDLGCEILWRATDCVGLALDGYTKRDGCRENRHELGGAVSLRWVRVADSRVVGQQAEGIGHASGAGGG